MSFGEADLLANTVHSLCASPINSSEAYTYTQLVHSLLQHILLMNSVRRLLALQTDAPQKAMRLNVSLNLQV